jgi:SSS family solute:Na+ symporter
MGLMLVALYATLICFIALGGQRRGTVGTDSCDAFFVNNRQSGAWGVGLSIVASCVGASATMGMIGMAFHAGLPAFWWLGAGCVGLLALTLLLSARVRASGAYTMPELAERHLGAPARPLIAAVILPAWTAILAAQFTALGGILQSVAGLSPTSALLLSLLLIVAHTLGGQAVIMRTDRLQAVVMFAAFIALLCWLGATHTASDTPLLPDFHPELINQQFPASRLWYFLLIVGGNYLVCPMLFGRFLSARDTSTARRGGFIAVAGLAVCAALITGIGIAARGVVPPGTPGDAVLPQLLAMAPSWLHLAVSLALLSVIVSSADSCLATAAAVLSNDLLRRRDALVSRAGVLALGLAGFALSLWGKSILEYLLMAYNVYVCGVVVPVFFGLVTGRRLAACPAFPCAAVVFGGGLGLAAALGGRTELGYCGMAVAALCVAAGLAWERGQPCKSSLGRL